MVRFLVGSSAAAEHSLHLHCFLKPSLATQQHQSHVTTATVQKRPPVKDVLAVLTTPKGLWYGITDQHSTVTRCWAHMIKHHR
jgi:hypothetical protein